MKHYIWRFLDIEVCITVGAFQWIFSFTKADDWGNNARCLHTFGGVQSFRSSAMFGIVVDEHVVGHSQEISLHTWGKRYDHLK